MSNPDDLNKLLGGNKSIIGRLNRVESQLRSITAESAGEMDAAAYLRETLQPSKYIPGAGGWAAPYRTIAYLVSLILEDEVDGDVLELGGGTSTIWLGLAAKIAGNTKVISLEHDVSYANRTADLLSRHLLDEYVDVVHASLAPVSIEDVEYQWYDTNGLALAEGSVGCLFIDGPPGTGGVQARYPAYPLLEPYLADSSWVLLDDADREDEREIGQRWRAAGEGGRGLVELGQVARTSIMRVEAASPPNTPFKGSE